MFEPESEQLDEYGIDQVELEKLVKQLEKCGKQLNKMGLLLFANAGHAELIIAKSAHDVIAELSMFPCDGGDWGDDET